MPTGDKRANIFVKRLLSKTAVREQFMDFLKARIDEIASALFVGMSGVLDSDEIGLGVGVSNNLFTLDVSAANKVGVSDGSIITIPANETGATKDVPFENAGGVTYYVGIHHAEVERDVDVNPRTGQPEYLAIEDSFGNVDYPTQVLDVAGVKLRLRLDSITEVGVSHAGRTCQAWLVQPKSAVSSVAFYSGVVVYSGGFNWLEIPYSGGNGPLGQDTTSLPPSVVTGDYRVFIRGATWKKLTNLSTDPNYAFIGTIIGGTPPTFSTVGQDPLFLITLDRAYDGPLGAGSGRSITVDGGAVELVTPAEVSPTWPETGDLRGPQLLLNRIDSYDYAQFALMTLGGDVSSFPLAIMQPSYAFGGFNGKVEVTKSGAVISVPGGSGVDFRNFRSDFTRYYLVMIVSGTEADRGVYTIAAFTQYTLTLRRPDGDVPVFTSETADAYLLYPRFSIGNSFPFSEDGEWLQGPLFTLTDGNGNPSDMTILSRWGGKVQMFDKGKNADQTTPHRKFFTFDPNLVGQELKWPFNFQRSMIIRGGNVTGGTGEESFYSRDGLRIWDAGGLYDKRDPCFPFVYDYLFPEDVPTYHTQPAFAVDANGIPCRGHFWEDHFMYSPDAWNGIAKTPVNYLAQTTGGDVKAKDSYFGAGNGYGHGVVEISSGTVYAMLEGPAALLLDTSYGFRWTFRARARLYPLSNHVGALGFFNGGGSHYWYFEWSHTTLTWHLIYYSGSSSQDYDTGIGADSYKFQWFEISVGYNTTYWTILQKDKAAGSSGSWSTSHAPLSGTSDVCMIGAESVNHGTSGALYLDFWGWYDREIVYARMGNSYNQDHGA